LNGRGRDNKLQNLVWETHQENQNRRRLHGATPWGGERSKTNVLTQAQVDEIRARLPENGRCPYGLCRALAREYGVSRYTIDRVRTRESWVM
jgi:hypothetical protein